MATLGGRSARTQLTNLEVLSDDGTLVLNFGRGNQSESLTIKVRKPWESRWTTVPTFTLDPRDADMLAKLVSGYDAWYDHEHVQRITSTNFTGEDPNPPAVEPDPNCAPLDIERAKAANLAEEAANLKLALTVQHMDGKHDDDDALGCELCVNRIRVGGRDVRYVEPLTTTDMYAPDENIEDTAGDLPY